MNSKVNRWYKTVHGIEMRTDAMQLPEIDAAITQLEAMDQKLSQELTVSTSYMPNVYTLREHVDYVIIQLRKRRERLTAEAQQATPSAATEESASSVAPASG